MTTEILKEISNKIAIQDTKGLVKDYETYIDVFIDLTNSLSESKTQMPKYKTKIEILLVRFALNAKTLLSIISGTKLKSKHLSANFTVVDIPSIYLICRSLLENYLTIFYLFIQDKENEEAIKYKNQIYEMSSLQKRQTIKPLVGSEVKRDLEKKTIQHLKTAIKNNLEFQKLSNKTKNKIFKAPAHRVPSKICSWKELFECCELQELFLSYWEMYSNYAHSEYLSVMQLEELFKKPDNFNFFSFNAIRPQIILIAHTIIEFSKLFECAEKKFQQQDEKTRLEIVLWNKIGVADPA